jgi:DNA-directed RNA polymerase subunit RPC12/RpoP
MRENTPVLLVFPVCDGEIILEKGEILCEKCQYRDPVGEQVVITTSTKCTYLGIIEVTRRQFQDAGTTCVECPTCGARRTLKSPKDRPHFPSHPRRLTPPPKGERHWIEQEQIWKLAED